jgi:hypothetical protein
MAESSVSTRWLQISSLPLFTSKNNFLLSVVEINHEALFYCVLILVQAWRQVQKSLLTWRGISVLFIQFLQGERHRRGAPNSHSLYERLEGTSCEEGGPVESVWFRRSVEGDPFSHRNSMCSSHGQEPLFFFFFFWAKTAVPFGKTSVVLETCTCLGFYRSFWDHKLQIRI